MSVCAKFTEKMTKFADFNNSRKESGMMKTSEKFLRIGGIVMKKAVNNLAKKNLFGVVNCLALLFTVLTSQLLCAWYFHQPEFPAEADKYRKFK